MGCEAGAPVYLRVVALQQQHVLDVHVRHVEPAMPRIEGDGVSLSDAVGIDEIGWDQVLRLDGPRVADSKRRVAQWCPDVPPQVDDLTDTARQLVCLCRQQIAHALRS